MPTGRPICASNKERRVATRSLTIIASFAASRVLGASRTPSQPRTCRMPMREPRRRRNQRQMNLAAVRNSAQGRKGDTEGGDHGDSSDEPMFDRQTGRVASTFSNQSAAQATTAASGSNPPARNTATDATATSGLSPARGGEIDNRTGEAEKTRGRGYPSPLS